MPGGNSMNPQARARALANLKRGANPTPGNGFRTSHGAYRELVDADDLNTKAREIFDALAADAPVRDAGALPAADAVTVRLLADALVRLDDIGDYLRRRGIEDKRGNLRIAALDVERRWQATAADLADRMGMSPTSRVKLGLDLARSFDLAQHWAEQGDAIDGSATDA